MKVASLLVFTLGSMLTPAVCQSTTGHTSTGKETPFIYAKAMADSSEWKLFPSAAEEGGSPAFPYVTPIAPMPAEAVRDLVRPDLQRPKPKLLEWKLSLLALAAAHSADAATSWNKREMNPLLAPNAGAFGLQTLIIKCAITAGSIGLQAYLLRGHPQLAKMFARINFMESGVIGATAIRNSFVPGR